MTSPSDVSGGQISHPGDQKKRVANGRKGVFFLGGGKNGPMS
jgi:hypothetical protein